MNKTGTPPQKGYPPKVIQGLLLGEASRRTGDLSKEQLGGVQWGLHLEQSQTNYISLSLSLSLNRALKWVFLKIGDPFLDG